MKTLNRISLVLVLACAGAFAQLNTLTATTTSAAITATQQAFTLTSVSGVTVSLSVQTLLFVDKEAMLVNSVATPSATSVTVQRGYAGTLAVPHINGAMVLLGRPDWFYNSDPTGACTAANTYANPYVNLANGNQWLCSTVSLAWVPGFGNPTKPAVATTTVASAAGTITPSGPMFTVSGTAAVTGFVIPVGFQYGSFTIIPTGAFTWTTAGNIGLAGTAVVGRALTFTWDASASKFYPSYV